ncbi:MAG TPA: DUF2786 domain-containing protein [Planctomycetota bacterium]|nr:DUF2786 domain-containing protein [Planctomycetota bacterium]
MTDLPAPQDVIERIQKLLNLAAKNPSAEEAAAASAKAQELLQKYNLDAALIERHSGKSDKREDLKLRGGFYEYQQSLWSAVARLNFCIYWTQVYWDDTRGRKYPDGTRQGVKSKRHRLVGRVVNTTTTKIMATYLEGAIEKLLRERLGGDNTQLFSRWAMSYREGAVARLVEKIGERQRAQLAEERAKEKLKTVGEGMGQALVLSHYINAEYDANIDFVYGEGTSARWASERAEKAAERKRAEAEYTAWAAAHPEEAKKREEAMRKERRSRSRGGPAPKEIDYNAYRHGQNAAEDISLDQQVDRGSKKGLAHG